MWLKWLPWKFLISKAAHWHGFLDPMMLLSYLERFSQPSEVAGPIELIRDSAIFHARGLINSRAIPQNSDWIWPYWVHRQFNPYDNAFIPRAFSLTYINLTERNWTAVGQPGCGYLPIVDGAGLVTPHWDGWSLDFWLVDQDGHAQAAARSDGKILQRLFYLDNLAVVSKVRFGEACLSAAVRMQYEHQIPCCKVRLRGRSRRHKWLAVSLRPYNPEGISFIHTIELDQGRKSWTINEKDVVHFDRPMDAHRLQEYSGGDAANSLKDADGERAVTCNVGMATAAALFQLDEAGTCDVRLSIPLNTRKLYTYKNKAYYHTKTDIQAGWQGSMNEYCTIEVPDKKKQLLYEQALRSVVLHTIKEDVYPGPFTYKRFWFRDASFILNALLCGNVGILAKPVLDSYPDRQKANGYFQSQYGEWDSNGQAIWILYRYWKMMRSTISDGWIESIGRAADWICGHCMDAKADVPHAGLLPAGFSAEHFGPNDYYYWDDFWAVSGLECAAEIFAAADKPVKAAKYTAKANELRGAIDRSLDKVAARLAHSAIPVSPYRRMDSGAVGSIVCGYPLQVFGARDPRLLATADYLMDRCRYKNGFFLDISHSGINPYLTLHLAQVLLRAGDARHSELADALVRLASPTGQWPEAVHPRTEGGCMGDGQHIWAAAEWVNYLRNCLVYEEVDQQQLILGAGIEPGWIRPGATMRIGPAPTLWGPVEIVFNCQPEGIRVRYENRWHHGAPESVIRIPGYPETRLTETDTEVLVKQKV
jgi:hypothetical protein